MTSDTLNASAAEDKALDDALEHYAAGRYVEAERLYRHVLSGAPHHPEALHYLGLISYQGGNIEAAVDCLRRAVATMPDYAEAQWNLATIYVKLKRWRDAEACCLTALKYEPNVPPLHFTLADALTAQNRNEEAIAHYKKAIVLTSGDPSSLALYHNNLGCAYEALRRFDDAEANFQKSIALDPAFALAHQNLANLLRGRGRKEEAIASFHKALELNPDRVSVQYNLDALQGRTTDAAPRAYIEELFDGFANRFDTQLQDMLEYKMPTLMRRRFDELGLSGRAYGTLVDLGCGTGLVGCQFKGVANRLIGIDVSQNMIRKAEEKGVYDHLIVDDIVNGLARVEHPVDLTISADVFVYVGNLRPAFEAVARAAKPGALFIFSTEHRDDPQQAGDGFILRDTSRYAHAKAYIDALAAEFGFQAVHFEQTPLRKEKSSWIPGALYVLKKS